MKNIKIIMFVIVSFVICFSSTCIAGKVLSGKKEQAPPGAGISQIKKLCGITREIASLLKKAVATKSNRDELAAKIDSKFKERSAEVAKLLQKKYSKEEMEKMKQIILKFKKEMIKELGDDFEVLMNSSFDPKYFESRKKKTLTNGG